MTTVSPALALRSWQGQRILALLCAVAFLDFVDASITNVALPHILTSLRFSVQSLQWVPSAYLLTYGGFMLLGGRLADLLGRRNRPAAFAAAAALIALATTNTQQDPDQAQGAEPQADSPLAAAAPEPISKEI
jgi:MFS family permease